MAEVARRQVLRSHGAIPFPSHRREHLHHLIIVLRAEWWTIIGPILFGVGRGGCSTVGTGVAVDICH